MKTGDVCTRAVIVIDEEDNALEAANLMRNMHVGDLVVLGMRAGVKVPVGIITDRDLTLEVLAMEIDPNLVRAGDLFMHGSLLTASVDDDIMLALDDMRRHGVRRMPVVNRDGSLAGILTVDDYLELLSEQIAGIVELVTKQKKMEQRRIA